MRRTATQTTHKPTSYRWQRQPRSPRIEYTPTGSYGWIWVVIGMIWTFGVAGWLVSL